MVDKLEAGERWQHVKRGTFYDVIGRAELQTVTCDLPDGADLVVYRGEDGKLWARDAGEFTDGRFVPITPATGAKSAQVAELVNFMETATRRVAFDPPAYVTSRMVAQLVAGEPVDGGTDVPKVATPANGEQVERADGYEAAFYTIGDMLGIGATPQSPKIVWETQMLPALRELTAVKQAATTEDARERVKVLEEALRPFAELGEHDTSESDHDLDIWRPSGFTKCPNINVGHLRAARTALGNKETDRHG